MLKSKFFSIPALSRRSVFSKAAEGPEHSASLYGGSIRFIKFGFVLLAISFAAFTTQAQYKGDHIPGWVGLDSGSQAPPGIYVGNILYAYPTDTVKDNNGNNIPLPGSLTIWADAVLVQAVTPYKVLGGNLGASIAFPWIQNRIQTDQLDTRSGWAYTDMFAGATLGWHLKRADVTAGYNLYMPTGSFNANSTSNSGLGMWANEFTLGSTVYLDEKRLWHLAGTFALEFNTTKSGTNIKPGDLGTVEGGFGRQFYKKTKGPIPIVMNLGAAYYAQFKVTGDSGSDIPPPLQGFKDHVFAVGPEFNILLPGPRLIFTARYEPEFGAQVHTQGQTAFFSIVWVAKPLTKH